MSPAARLGDGADDVERLVAVKRRDLDGEHVFDLDEPPPEREGQHAAADRRLEIKADQGNRRGHRAAVGEQGLARPASLHGAQAEQAGVISQARASAASGTACGVRPQMPAIRTSGSRPRLSRRSNSSAAKAQDGLEQPDFGLADGELRRVDADGNPARSGCRIVSPYARCRRVSRRRFRSSAKGLAGMTSPRWTSLRIAGLMPWAMSVK